MWFILLLQINSWQSELVILSGVHSWQMTCHMASKIFRCHSGEQRTRSHPWVITKSFMSKYHSGRSETFLSNLCLSVCLRLAYLHNCLSDLLGMAGLFLRAEGSAVLNLMQFGHKTLSWGRKTKWRFACWVSLDEWRDTVNTSFLFFRENWRENF